MKRAPYVIGITSLLLAACSTTNVENTYELSSKSGNGVIVGSITSSGALADYRIYYRKIGSSGDGSFVLASSDPSLNAKLIVAELPAGDYEVFRWLVTINGGNLKLEVSPRVGFSIPFHVAPGEAVYIGSCNFAFTMRDGVANVAATSVACTDESARDLQELAVRYPRLASMTAGLHAARAELYRDNRFSARRVGPPEPPGLPGAE